MNKERFLQSFPFYIFALNFRPIFLAFGSWPHPRALGTRLPGQHGNKNHTKHLSSRKEEYRIQMVSCLEACKSLQMVSGKTSTTKMAREKNRIFFLECTLLLAIIVFVKLKGVFMLDTHHMYCVILKASLKKPYMCDCMCISHGQMIDK